MHSDAGTKRPDPVTLEIVTSALVAASQEMGVGLQRAAYSTIIREVRDFSCAVFDASGRLVSQAAHIPIHLGSMDIALSAILERFRPDLHPGDAYVLNDPYSGAQHTPDVQMFSPVFSGDNLVAFVGNVAHHLDMGGRIAGSVAGDNTEIFHDGLRIPPCRAYVKGQIDPLFETIFSANIRQPAVSLGDLRAQLAANEIGVHRVLETIDKFGEQMVSACIDQAILDTEAALRAHIARLPRRRLEGEDWIDDDGVGNGPLRVAVGIEPDGDDLVIDLTGTGPQTSGAINSILSATRAAVMYAIRAVIGPELSPNHGAQVPVRIIAPPGSLVNPEYPAACGGRMVTCQRIVDAMLAAFSEVMPERVTAGSNGNMTTGLGISTGQDRSIFFEVMPGGMGARACGDGISGTDSHLSNCMNAPIEALELEHPVLFELFEFRPDSGGAGQFQGGLGLTRQFRLLEGSATLMIRGDQVLRGPLGLRGGRPGRPCRFVLNPGRPDERVLPSKVSTEMKGGDVLRRDTAGGGGFGDPQERQQELIIRDLQEGWITATWATEQYSIEMPDPEEVARCVDRGVESDSSFLPSI
jgi:N-methylhydantoinase B